MTARGDDAARRLDQAVDDLLGRLEPLSPEALQRRPRQGEWSALENLAHVAEMVPFWAERARAVADGRLAGQSYARTPDESALRSAAVDQHGRDSLEEQRARVRAGLRQAMEALRSMPDDSWSRTARWSDGQIHSVADIVELRLVRHVEAHAQQAVEAARS